MTVRFQMQAKTSNGLIPLPQEPVAAHTVHASPRWSPFSFGQYGQRVSVEVVEAKKPLAWTSRRCINDLPIAPFPELCAPLPVSKVFLGHSRGTNAPLLPPPTPVSALASS